MKKNLLLICIIVFCNAKLFAQQPTWVVNLGIMGTQDIKYIKKAGTGIILVCTSSKLYGVSGKEKKVLWEQSRYADTNYSTVNILTNTAYVFIYNSRTAGFTSNNATILNTETGEILLDAQDENMQLSDRTFLPKNNAILIAGKRNGNGFLRYLDLNAGKELWTKTFDSKATKTSGLLGSVMKLAEVAGVNYYPLQFCNDIDGSKEVIVAINKALFCIDIKTGNERWKKEYKDRIYSFKKTDVGDELFINVRTKLNAINITTGEEKFVDPPKSNATLVGINKTDSGYIIKSTNGYNLLQPDGTFKWNKNRARGMQVRNMRFEADGYLVDDYLEPVEKAEIERELNRQKKENDRAVNTIRDNSYYNETLPTTVAKYNFDGDKIWDFTYNGKVPLVSYTPKGIFIVTGKEANMYGYADGKKIWDEGIKLKGETFFGFDYDSTKIYAYNRGKLESFGLLDASYRNITTEFKFSDKLLETDIVAVEPRKNGIFLNSNQNVAMVDYTGKTLYSKNVVDPTGLSKRAKDRISLIGSLVSVAAFAYQINTINRGSKGKLDKDQFSQRMSLGENIKQTSGGIAALADAADLVYYQTKKSLNTISIITNDGLLPAVAILDKDTGIEKRRVKIVDPTSLVYVDDADNTLYVLNKLLELKTYSLN